DHRDPRSSEHCRRVGSNSPAPPRQPASCPSAADRATPRNGRPPTMRTRQRNWRREDIAVRKRRMEDRRTKAGLRMENRGQKTEKGGRRRESTGESKGEYPKREK